MAAGLRLFLQTTPSIMSHNFHVPTKVWAAFRARLAHYLGQQHRLLVATNEPHRPFAPTGMHSVAGLPLEFPNEAFQHTGYINFTEVNVRYVFKYAFSHALPIHAWESLVWKISASM